MEFLEEFQAKQFEFSQSYKLIAAKNIQQEEQAGFDYEDLHSIQDVDHEHGHDHDHGLYHVQEEVEEEQPISEQDLEANADKQEEGHNCFEKDQQTGWVQLEEQEKQEKQEKQAAEKAGQEEAIEGLEVFSFVRDY